MRDLEKVTIGFIIFFIIDRSVKIISSSILSRQGKTQEEMHRTILRVEITVLIIALLISLRLWS
jgi:hypothetical protein